MRNGVHNIILILSRTGDEWRELSWSEYKTERKKDGDFSNFEQEYFDRVIDYATAERIALVSKDYKRISEGK